MKNIFVINILLILLAIVIYNNAYGNFDIEFVPISKIHHNQNNLQENQHYSIKVSYKSNNFKIDANPTFNLCLLTGFYFYNDTRFIYFKKHKLVYDTKNYNFTTGIIEVPANSTLFYYQLYENNTKLSDFKFLPIVNKENNFNKGTREYYVINSDSMNFIDHFFNEIKEYPDNINIYPLKWINFIKYRIGSQDDIKKRILEDIQIIDQINTNYQNKEVIKYIGYQLLKDTMNILKYGAEISNFENIPLLNNYFISDLLLNLLTKDRSYNEISQDSIFFKLIINNPESMLIESIVKGGLLLDLYPSNMPQVANLVDLLSKKEKKNLLSISEKIALAYYMIFSKDTNNNIIGIKQIKNLLDLYFNDDYCNRNDDPLNHLYIKRTMLFNLATVAFIRNNLFEQGIELQNYLLEKYKPSDIEFQDAAYYKARFFQQKNHVDSMLYWYAVSYKLNNNIKNYNKIKKYLNEKYKYDNDVYSAWFDSVCRKYNIDLIKVERYEGPDIITIRGEKIDISDGNYLLEFYTKNCTFCRSNLQSLNNYTSEYLNLNKIKILVVTDIPKKDFDKEFSKLLFPFDIISNSKDIISYFNVTNFPVTILINNGTIAKHINGGNKFGINLKELLE